MVSRRGRQNGKILSYGLPPQHHNDALLQTATKPILEKDYSSLIQILEKDYSSLIQSQLHAGPPVPVHTNATGWVLGAVETEVELAEKGKLRWRRIQNMVTIRLSTWHSPYN